MDREFLESLADLRRDLMRCDSADAVAIYEALLTLIELLQERELRQKENAGS